MILSMVTERWRPTFDELPDPEAFVNLYLLEFNKHCFDDWYEELIKFYEISKDREEIICAKNLYNRKDTVPMKQLRMSNFFP